MEFPSSNISQSIPLQIKIFNIIKEVIFPFLMNAEIEFPESLKMERNSID